MEINRADRLLAIQNSLAIGAGFRPEVRRRRTLAQLLPTYPVFPQVAHEVKSALVQVGKMLVNPADVRLSDHELPSVSLELPNRGQLLALLIFPRLHPRVRKVHDRTQKNFQIEHCDAFFFIAIQVLPDVKDEVPVRVCSRNEAETLHYIGHLHVVDLLLGRKLLLPQDGVKISDKSVVDHFVRLGGDRASRLDSLALFVALNDEVLLHLLLPPLSVLEQNVLDLVLSLNSRALLLDLRHMHLGGLLIDERRHVSVELALLLLKQPLIHVRRLHERALASISSLQLLIKDLL